MGNVFKLVGERRVQHDGTFLENEVHGFSETPDPTQTSDPETRTTEDSNPQEESVALYHFSVDLSKEDVLRAISELHALLDGARQDHLESSHGRLLRLVYAALGILHELRQHLLGEEHEALVAQRRAHEVVEPDRLAKIQAAAGTMAVVNASDDAQAHREIADADAFFGKLTPSLRRASKRLRWVQSPTASLEHYMYPELVSHPCVLTNMRGLFSDAIADHVFGFMLCFARNLHRYIRQQMRAHWEPVSKT